MLAIRVAGSDGSDIVKTARGHKILTGRDPTTPYHTTYERAATKQRGNRCAIANA